MIKLHFVDKVWYSPDGLKEYVNAKDFDGNETECLCVNRKILAEPNDLILVVPKYSFIDEKYSSVLNVRGGVIDRDVCFNVTELIPMMRFKHNGKVHHVVDCKDFDFSLIFDIVLP